MAELQNSRIRGPLTRELDDPRSPVRVFLDQRFAPGLRAIQNRYRAEAPESLLVPSGSANAGTVGTAADWLMRFLLTRAPDLTIPTAGARRCDQAGLVLTPALQQLAEILDLTVPEQPVKPLPFDGPAEGHGGEPELLARACWVLALLTEPVRAGVQATMLGPLGRFQNAQPGMKELLALASPDALEQLAGFRKVFDEALIPNIGDRHGPWVIGPTFQGSRLVGGADADLIAARLLLDVKTTAKKLSLARVDVFQLLAYTLLDFENAYSLDSVGLSSARYGYMVIWNLRELLKELSGCPVDLAALREEFRQMLLATQPKRPA